MKLSAEVCLTNESEDGLSEGMVPRLEDGGDQYDISGSIVLWVKEKVCSSTIYGRLVSISDL